MYVKTDLGATPNRFPLAPRLIPASMATKAREHTLQPRPVDHAMGGTASAASPNVQHLPNPQPSDTADPMSSVEATSHAILARTVSAPATATKRRNTERTQADPAPRGKGRLPYHPTAQPKEKLPEGNPVPSFEKMFKGLLQPTRPVGDAPSVPRQLRNIATYSWLNVLLLFVPVSWAVVSKFLFSIFGAPLINGVLLRTTLDANRWQSHTACPIRRNLFPCTSCSVTLDGIG